MKNLVIRCLVLVAFSFFSLVAFGPISGQKKFVGHMDYSTDSESIFLMSKDGLTKVNLIFPFDDASTLIIDDFDEVSVSGYYFEFFNILRVEEIAESTLLPALCCLGT